MLQPRHGTLNKECSSFRATHIKNYVPEYVDQAVGKLLNSSGNL